MLPSINSNLLRDPEGRQLAHCQKLPRIVVRLAHLDGYSVEALLDTGSEGNIVSSDIAKKYRLQPTSVTAHTTSYSNTKVEILGEVEIPVYLGNTYIPQRMYVAPASVVSIPFILGMPFVRAAKVSFDHMTRGGEMHVRCQLGATRVVTPVAGRIR